MSTPQGRDPSERDEPDGGPGEPPRAPEYGAGYGQPGYGQGGDQPPAGYGSGPEGSGSQPPAYGSTAAGYPSGAAAGTQEYGDAPAGPPPGGYGSGHEGYSGQPAYPGQPGATGQPGSTGQPGYTGQPSGFGGVPGALARNGLGWAALAIGVVALVMSWIPLLGLVLALVAVAGIVLGVTGRRRARRGEASNAGVALAGILTSAAAIGIAVITHALYFYAISQVDTSGFDEGFPPPRCEQYLNDEQLLQQCLEEEFGFASP